MNSLEEQNRHHEGSLVGVQQKCMEGFEWMARMARVFCVSAFGCVTKLFSCGSVLTCDKGNEILSF